MTVGSLKLTYFVLPNALSGRGGAVRFFLLRRGLPFVDDAFPMADWEARKQRLLASGDSPTGQLPVLYQDGVPLTEHHAILRKLSRRLGEYGSDEARDYAVDRLASLANDWRTAVLSGIFGDDAARQKYLDGREALYKLWDGLVEKAGGSGAHALAGGTSYVDDLLFGLLWDDGRAFGFDVQDAAPTLKAFFNAYRAQPKAAEWADGAAEQAAASA